MSALSSAQLEALAVLHRGPAPRTTGRTANGCVNRQAVLALCRRGLAQGSGDGMFAITNAGRLAYEQGSAEERRLMPPPTAEHVEGWRAFIATVEVRGPIPIRFAVVQDRLGEWVLISTMTVPSRTGGEPLPIHFCNKPPGPDLPMREVVLSRVLQAFQHEALESVYVNGERIADPHRDRWYSDLVADWRLCP